MNIYLEKCMSKFVYCALTVILILILNTVYIDSYPTLKKYLVIMFLVLSLLIFIFLLPKIFEESILKKFILMFSLIVIIFFILNSFMFHFNAIHLITFLVIPLTYTSFFYFKKDPTDSFIKTIEYFTVINACISLLFWVMSNLGVDFNSIISVHWGAPEGMTRSLSGYFDISFVTQTLNVGDMTIIRNSSFFSEAPVYAYFLSISLLIELFIMNGRKSNFRTYVLLLTILSTLSTIGIVIAVSAVSYYYLFVYNSNSLAILKFFKKFFAIILAISVVITVLYDKIVISDGSSSLSSSNIRADDFKACFLAFIQHPIIGNGLDNANAIVKNMNPLRYGFNTGLSTGMMVALAYGGVYLLLFYLMPFFVSFKCSKKEIGLGLFTFLLTLFITDYESYIYVILSSYIFAVYLRKLKYKNIYDENIS